MCGTPKVGWRGLVSLLRLLTGDLVIHVGRNKGNGLSSPACCNHLISGDVASADRNE